MATLLIEVYDAFKEAGASEEKSRSAASALANYASRFSKAEADLLVLKWMVGATLAGIVSLVLKAFF